LSSGNEDPIKTQAELTIFWRYDPHLGSTVVHLHMDISFPTVLGLRRSEVIGTPPRAPTTSVAVAVAVPIAVVLAILDIRHVPAIRGMQDRTGDGTLTWVVDDGGVGSTIARTMTRTVDDAGVCGGGSVGGVVIGVRRRGLFVR
jgi:hypothetical protein